MQPDEEQEDVEMETDDLGDQNQVDESSNEAEIKKVEKPSIDLFKSIFASSEESSSSDDRYTSTFLYLVLVTQYYCSIVTTNV